MWKVHSKVQIHYHKFVVAIMCSKCDFVDVGFTHPDLVVAGTKVKLGVDGIAMQVGD